jgi:hypothetical protein
MDVHRKVLYGLIGLTTVGIAWLGYREMPTDDPSFSTIPFGAHAYVVYAAPGALREANAIAKAIRAHGGMVTLDNDLNEHVGLWVAPKGDESQRIADALNKITNETVVVDDYEPGAKAYGTPYQIGVGVPPAK